RLAFGLPYHPQQQRDGWDIEYRGRPAAKGQDDSADAKRRASPLLLKVFRLAPRRYVGIALFLEASFFGDPGREIGTVGRPHTQPFPVYGAVSALLDGSGWTEVAFPWAYAQGIP